MGGLHSTEVVKDTSAGEVQKWLQSPDDHFFINIRAPNLLQVVDAPGDILQQLLQNLAPDQSSPNTNVVSVTFLTPSTIDISGNEDTCLDVVCTIVKSALTTTFQALHAEKKECALSSASECSRKLEVPCNLWKCVSVPESIISRRFLLEIIAQLERIGYRLSICIDFRGNADTLFFTKINHETTTGTYCMLSANRWNLLRVYEAPKDLVDVTRLLLNQHWSQGIESESDSGNWHEFQLSAFPWAARGAEAVQSHSMVASILQTYLARGWKPIASVQMSRTFEDRSAIVLRKEKPAYRPHMCLGLLDSNELHLINTEDDLRDYIIALARSKAHVKGKVPKTNMKGGWPFLTLRGDPWCTVSLAHYQNGENGHHETTVSSYDHLEARAFVQKLLIALRFRGWDTAINVDLAARLKYKRKVSGGSRNSSGGKSSICPCEDSMPLDVNSLILASVNGSRHNSIGRAITESVFVIRTQLSVD